MTAIAASLSLKAPIAAGKEIDLSGSMNQAITELGERTPVIQMLRDSLYRACEAHMNGLLNEEEYRNILSFFDIYSMTVMAIEDLTHNSRSPVVLSTGAQAKITADGTESSSQPASSSGGTLPASSDKKDVAKEVKSILCNYYKVKLIMGHDYQVNKSDNTHINDKEQSNEKSFDVCS